MEKHYLTKEGFEVVKKELEKLKTKTRREVAERLKQAKEYGDLAENSEYAEAKDAKASLEARIFELEDIIRTVEIIGKSRNMDVVGVGSEVQVKRNGATLMYRIVGSDEADPAKNLISHKSPIGKAFIGKKVGDSVSIVTPRGNAEYEIVGIA